MDDTRSDRSRERMTRDGNDLLLGWAAAVWANDDGDPRPLPVWRREGVHLAGD